MNINGYIHTTRRESKFEELSKRKTNIIIIPYLSDFGSCKKRYLNKNDKIQINT